MLYGREDKNGSVAEMTRRMQPNRRALDLLIRPTHVEIDLAALEKNVSLARRMSPGGQLMVVVKANAYGHGAILVARARERLKRFRGARQELLGRGVHPNWRHISNAAAVMDLPEARDGDLFNLARPGLMSYGLSPTDRFALREQLQPVLCWKTKITHLKQVAAGTPISYGGNWTAPKQSVIATLPVGYADGYNPP